MHIANTLVPTSPPLDEVLNTPLQRAFAHEWVIRLPSKAAVQGNSPPAGRSIYMLHLGGGQQPTHTSNIFMCAYVCYLRYVGGRVPDLHQGKNKPNGATQPPLQEQ